ncbi:DUF4862 family protein [Jiangella anatolica]|uniref:DUF4862 domain-containing protein n=1 Tax=Jiangella anatolica TaxID=2670374 RepID=A0A2W2CFR3_9ACTN|nr:DUF4862 family protein [Jiangella anatolica]PZF84496.1 DUF4862 domain-containing protein [Jiangella anatolica]
MPFIVGAYAAAPRGLEPGTPFRTFVDDVLAVPAVDGLEVPFLENGSPWSDPSYLHATSAASQHVLTMIPATMMALAASPGQGLASSDDGGRKQAVEQLRRAYEFVAAANAGPGGRFAAVEVHPAPRHPYTSADAFRSSLDEALTWDWDGVRLLIEHSDAHTDTYPPSKGFLPLADELDVADERGIGVVVNWARSVIETRDAHGAREHIAAAVARGRLGGLVFSGVSDAATLDGPAWADLHLPIRDWSDEPVAADAATSLLTVDEVTACVAAAGAPEFVGVKITSPSNATPAECRDLVRAHVAIVAAAVG